MDLEKHDTTCLVFFIRSTVSFLPAGWPRGTARGRFVTWPTPGAPRSQSLVRFRPVYGEESSYQADPIISRGNCLSFCRGKSTLCHVQRRLQALPSREGMQPPNTFPTVLEIEIEISVIWLQRFGAHAPEWLINQGALESRGTQHFWRGVVEKRCFHGCRL